MLKIEDSLNTKIWTSIEAGILIVGLVSFGIVMSIKERSFNPECVMEL